MLFWIIMLCLLLLLAILYYCWRQVFWVPREVTLEPKILLKGTQYEERKKQMLALIGKAMEIPYEEVTCRSFDGLTLWGRYYEVQPGAPLQIQFHGYRSNAIKDFSGGMQLARELGCNVLLVDERGHGKSGGSFLSFGVLERRDCLSWLDYARQRFGADTPMFLVGISMGAGTVLMASELELPDNVKGIISDCGFSSPKAIIQKVMVDMHYPVAPLYPFVRLCGLVFGRFDMESCSAKSALTRCRKPVLFIHGEADHFVPCDMTRENYAACASRKTLLTVPGAGHGLSYLVDRSAYTSAVEKFLRECLANPENPAEN